MQVHTTGGLTKRELEAVFWTANGRHPDEIALLMGVSRKRVNNLLYSVRGKLKVHTTAHAIAVTLKTGQLTLDHIYDTVNPPETTEWLKIVAKLLTILVFLSGTFAPLEDQALRVYRVRPTRQNRETHLGYTGI